MKYIITVYIAFYSLMASCQVTDTIEVGFTKSAYIIFDGEKVKYDCGSEDVIVRNSDNIIILQAGVENFNETNLFVSANGEFFMFVIKYLEEPKTYMYSYQRSARAVKSIPADSSTTVGRQNESFSIKSNSYGNKSDKADYYSSKSKEIEDMANRIFNRGIKKYRIGLYLRDIAINDKVIYFKFDYENKSNIGYKLDFLQYSVESVKRHIKGESQQNIYLKPLFEYNLPESFGPNEKGSFVIIFDKFALTNNKKLRLEFWEDNGEDLDIEGGRKINFDIFSKDVLNVIAF